MMLPSLQKHSATQRMAGSARAIANKYLERPEHDEGQTYSSDDDDLVLFQDIQHAETSGLLDSNTDDLEDSLSRRLSAFTDSSTHTQKSEYDWLLTPPGTPQSSLHEKDPYAKHGQKSKQGNSSTAIPIQPRQIAAKGATSSGSMLRGTSPRSIHNDAFKSNYSCKTQSLGGANTNSRADTTLNSIKPSTPRRRSPTPPMNRSKPTTQKFVSNSNGQEFVHDTRGHSPGKHLRRNSLSKVQVWQSSIPGFSIEAPPNLRTSIPDQSKSRPRGLSPSRQDNRARTRQQSASPRGPRHVGHPFDHDSAHFNSHGRGVLSTSLPNDTSSLDSTFSSKKISPVNSISQDRVTRRKESQYSTGILPASNKQMKPKRADSISNNSSAKQKTTRYQNSTSMFRPLLMDVPSTSLYSSPSLTFKNLYGSSDSNARGGQEVPLASYSEGTQDGGQSSFSFPNRNTKFQDLEEDQSSDFVASSKEACEALDELSDTANSNVDEPPEHSGEKTLETVDENIPGTNRDNELHLHRASCSESENCNVKLVGSNIQDIPINEHWNNASINAVKASTWETIGEEFLRKTELETMQKHDTWLRKELVLPMSMETDCKKMDTQFQWHSVDSHNVLQYQLDGREVNLRYQSLSSSDRGTESFEPDQGREKMSSPIGSNLLKEGYEYVDRSRQKSASISGFSICDPSSMNARENSHALQHSRFIHKSREKTRSCEELYKSDISNNKICDSSCIGLKAFSRNRSKRCAPSDGMLPVVDMFHADKLTDTSANRSGLSIKINEMKRDPDHISFCSDAAKHEGYFELSPDSNKIKSMTKIENGRAVSRDEVSEEKSLTSKASAIHIISIAGSLEVQNFEISVKAIDQSKVVDRSGITSLNSKEENPSDDCSQPSLPDVISDINTAAEVTDAEESRSHHKQEGEINGGSSTPSILNSLSLDEQKSICEAKQGSRMETSHQNMAEQKCSSFGKTSFGHEYGSDIEHENEIETKHSEHGQGSNTEMDSGIDNNLVNSNRIDQKLMDTNSNLQKNTGDFFVEVKTVSSDEKFDDKMVITSQKNIDACNPQHSYNGELASNELEGKIANILLNKCQVDPEVVDDCTEFQDSRNKFINNGARNMIEIKEVSEVRPIRSRAILPRDENTSNRSAAYSIAADMEKRDCKARSRSNFTFSEQKKADKQPSLSTLKRYKQQNSYNPAPIQPERPNNPVQLHDDEEADTKRSASWRRILELRDAEVFCKSVVLDEILEKAIAESKMENPTPPPSPRASPGIHGSGYSTPASEEPLMSVSQSQRKSIRRGESEDETAAPNASFPENGIRNVAKVRENSLRVVTIPQRDALAHERRQRQKCCGCRCRIL